MFGLTPDQLLGPAALTVALLVAVGALWRDHQKRVEREHSEDADTIRFLRAALEEIGPAVKELTEVVRDALGVETEPKPGRRRQ